MNALTSPHPPWRRWAGPHLLVPYLHSCLWLWVPYLLRGRIVQWLRMWPQDLGPGPAYWLMGDSGQVDFEVPVPQSPHRYIGAAVSSKRADLYPPRISGLLGAPRWPREQALLIFPLLPVTHSFSPTKDLTQLGIRAGETRDGSWILGVTAEKAVEL